MCNVKLMEETIAEWREIKRLAEGGRYDEIIVGKGCALCKHYLTMNTNRKYKCGECPIKLKTKTDACYNTPFYKVYNTLRRVLDIDRGRSNLMEAIDEEIVFLQEVLAGEFVKI